MFKMYLYADLFENKHKFVQKVAKKNILLIYFRFSASISSVYKRGFARLNEVKRYHMGSNLVKLDQVGPNRAKHLSNRVKQGQTRLNRLKWDSTLVNRGKLP